MRTSQDARSMIDTSLFPYETFPVRLQFGEKKDYTSCWFKDDTDLQKYLNRYKLDKRKVKVDYRNGEPTQSNKTSKKKVRSGTGKSSDGGSSGSKRSTKSVDKPRNVSSTRKSKPKPKPKSK